MDFDGVKDLPGYKAIYKTIMKSLIQQMVDQLATETEDETILLTTSIEDGTVNYLASNTAKAFVDDHDHIKSQFISFCLKKHYEKRQGETKNKPVSSSTSSHSIASSQSKRYSPYSRQNAGGKTATSTTNREERLNTRSTMYEDVSTDDGVSVTCSFHPASAAETVGNKASTDSDNASILVVANLDSNNPAKMEATNEPSESTLMTNEEMSDDDTMADDQSTDDQRKVKHKPEPDNDIDIQNSSEGRILSVVEQADRKFNLERREEKKDCVGRKTDGLHMGGIFGQTQTQSDNERSKLLAFKIITGPDNPLPRAGRFFCDICNTVFSFRTNLRRHMKLHTEAKDVSCQYCSYKTTRSDHLKSHIITMHSEHLMNQ